MEKSIIIKLRQSEATETESNGSYSVTLKTPVMVEEGDVVKVHTVVLDTATESVVNVENDLQIVMTTARYIRNYKFGVPFEMSVNPIQTAAAVVHPLPDLRLSWVCSRDESSGVNYYVDSLVMRTDSTNITRNFGRDYPVSFEYFDPITGQQEFDQFNLPSFPIISHMNKGIIIPIKRRVRGKYFKLTVSNKELSKEAGVAEFTQEQDLSPIGFGTPVNPVNPDITRGVESSVCWGPGEPTADFPNGAPGGVLSNSANSIKLFTEKLSFRLPASTYTPTEIAQIVNGQMTKLLSTGNPGSIGYNGAGRPIGAPGQGKFLVNNPFLTTVAQLREKINFDGGSVEGNSKFVFSPGNTTATAKVAGTEPIFGNDYILEVVDLATAFVDNNQDRFIGASQCSMNFDTNLKKLNFDALHFPAYGTADPTGFGALEPGVDYSNIPGTEQLQPAPAGGDVPTEPQPSYGGVGFTGLQAFDLENATDADGNIIEVIGKRNPFWETLGFDASCLVKQVDIGTAVTGLDAAGDGSIFPIQVVADLGRNIVGADPTIDGVVRKKSAAAAPVGLPFVGFVANNLTTPILSNRTFDQVSNDEGYYMLEVNMKFPQQMIGGSRQESETNSNSVQSIIGKYFTSGNFLQSQGSGEIIYTHVGQPQLVNDLNVRVLHPDFSIPTDTELGKKNSVFLEIVKPALRPMIQNDSQPPTKK